MPDNEQNNGSSKESERIARIEAAMEAQSVTLREMQRTIDTIRDMQSRTREVNWPLIVMIGGLFMTMWASTIRPLAQELDRREPIITGNRERISEVTAVMMRNTMRIENLERDLSEIRDKGSPITDKRLSILELKTKDMVP